MKATATLNEKGKWQIRVFENRKEVLKRNSSRMIPYSYAVKHLPKEDAQEGDDVWTLSDNPRGGSYHSSYNVVAVIPIEL